MLGINFLSAGELPPGGILNFDMQTLVSGGIQWLNIILLAFVLYKILYEPVKKFMGDRAERVVSDIESARLSKEQAAEIKASYQEMIDNIEQEKEKILSDAHRAAVKKSDRILFDAQEEAKYMIAKAHDEIKMERDNASDEIKMQIIEVSSLIASRFVEVSVDRQTQDKYIDEALADWSEQV